MVGNLRAALAPTSQMQYPREHNTCDTSLWGGVGRTRAQGLKIKHSNTTYSDSNLEIVLLGFASHDDVERLVWVFGVTLNAAGHVLLVLVWIQPYTERSGVSSQLGLRVRS